VSLAHGSTGSKIAFAILAVATAFILPQLIPESTWERMGTLESEIVGGTLGNRTIIWSAGIDIWLNHLAFGVGTGAFSAATVLMHGFAATCHNTYLQILVELGATGFMIFGGLMFVIWKQIQVLPVLERRLYLLVCAVLVLGISTLTWETKKPVWLLCSLILCHGAVLSTRKEGESNEAQVVEEAVSGSVLQVKSEQQLLKTRNGV
jgi:O-antigen ligase